MKWLAIGLIAANEIRGLIVVVGIVWAWWPR